MKEKRFKSKIRKAELLSQKIYKILKEDIIKHKIPSNSHLKESKLALDLGVSRSPVREALRKLASEGFVTIIPNKGAIVNEISIQDVINIYQIRGVLFGLAAFLSCEKISKKELDRLDKILNKMKECLKSNDSYNFSILDEEFDNLILKSSQNDRLIDILSKLNDHIRMVRFESLSVPGRMEKAFNELKNIFDSIKRRIGEEAERLFKDHSKNALENILNSRLKQQFKK